MALYHLKRPTIEAVQLDEPIDLPYGIHGEIGDWLLTNAEGGQVIVTNDDFVARFEIVT